MSLFTEELIKAREEIEYFGNPEEDDLIQCELPKLCPLSDYKECPPPARFIIDNLASVGDVSMLNGGSGIGKTMLALLAAVSVANGRKFLGLSVEQGDVVFINPEMREETIIHRVWKLSEALSLPTNAPVYFFNTAGFSIGLDEIRTNVYSQCLALGIEPKLIVADSLYLSNAGDENSAGDMTKNMRELQGLTIDLNAALLFIHHTSKGSQSGKDILDQASGSGVLGRFVAAQASLGRLNADTVLTDDYILDSDLVEQIPYRLEWGKYRHTAAPKPINLWYGYPLFKVCETGELDGKKYLDSGHRAKQAEKIDVQIRQVVDVVKEFAETHGRSPESKDIVPILKKKFELADRTCADRIKSACEVGLLIRSDKQPYKYEVKDA